MQTYGMANVVVFFFFFKPKLTAFSDSLLPTWWEGGHLAPRVSYLSQCPVWQTGTDAD